MTVKCVATFLLAAVVITTAPLAQSQGGKATYVGGTLAVAEKMEGKLFVGAGTEALFAYKGGEVRIPYASIESIEYGQKVGRRVGVAIMVNPLFLFSKKRKHYVTVSFADAAGAKQGAVFEVAKDAAGLVVLGLEVRSGKSVIYESDEAREHLAKESK